MIEIIETNYTLKATEPELRALCKGIRCLELYGDQDPELEMAELSDSERQVLRNLRAQLDEFI